MYFFTNIPFVPLCGYLGAAEGEGGAEAVEPAESKAFLLAKNTYHLGGGGFPPPPP